MLFGNVDPSPGAYYSGLSKMLPSYDKLNLSTQLIQRLHQIEGQGKLPLPPRHAAAPNNKVVNDFNEQPPQRPLINYVGDNQHQGTINDYFNSVRPQQPYNNDECALWNQAKAGCLNNNGGSAAVHRKIRKCLSHEYHPTSFNIDSVLNNGGGGTLMAKQQQPLPTASSPCIQGLTMPFSPHLQPLISATPSVSSNSGATSRYKTELCRPFEESGECKYGDKCQFAHGIAEMRNLSRHPKYKTELCRTFHSIGFCPYGPRCHFIHNKEEAGTLVLEDDEILSKNDSGIVKFYQNQQNRHQSLPATTLLNSTGPYYPPLPNANVHNYPRNFGLPPHKQQLPSLLSNGSFSMSSSQLYDSIQNTIAIAAASAAIKSNGNTNGVHAGLESRKSLPTIMPSLLMAPPPQHDHATPPDLDALVSTMKYFNINHQQQPQALVQKQRNSPLPVVSSTNTYDEHQGSAYDSGIEDSSSVYTTLFNSILRKQQTSNNNSLYDATAKHHPIVGTKNGGASSPDSNFSGNSEGANDLDFNEHRQQAPRSNCSIMTLLNPRLPIFKSFSAETY